jgi:hypothetical protein
MAASEDRDEARTGQVQVSEMCDMQWIVLQCDAPRTFCIVDL